MPPRVLQDPVANYENRVVEVLSRNMEQLEQRVQAIPGLGLMPQPNGTLDAAWQLTVTSGSFVSPWTCKIPRLSRAGLSVLLPFNTAAATTGEAYPRLVRLVDSVVVATGATQTIPAGTVNNVRWWWEHGVPCWSGEYRIDMMVRRASGSGVVLMIRPFLHLIEPGGCFSDGVHPDL